MPDEATDLIVGDAAVDATEEGRRGAPPLRRRKRRSPRKKVRVLTHCENCGTELAGEWCAQCGQHAVDYRRSIWRVLVDALDSFLNWDTKFLSTIAVLLTKPWRLTNDFNAGKRARYVHPLRLYLLASIAFFLMFKLVNLEGDGPLSLSAEDRAELAGLLAKFTGPDSALSPDQQAKVESLRSRLAQGEGPVNEEEKDAVQEIVREALKSKMRDRFDQGERQRLRAKLRRLPEIPAAAADAAAKGQAAGEAGRAQAGAEVAQQVAKELAAAGITAPSPPPVDVPSPPKVVAPIQFDPGDEPKNEFEKWLEGRIKGKVGEDGTKAKLWLETLRNNIPTMMLCCVPLFALVLKVLYLRQRRFYIEHLIYALNIHTFAYLAVTVIVLVAVALAQISEGLRVFFSIAGGFTVFGLVLLSIRHVYREGWFFTFFKFLLGAVAYAAILMVGVGITAFITLLLPD